VRVVLDTNVLLAAFGTRGLCEALLDVCLEAHELVLSQYILDELREHLVGKFKVPKGQAAAIVRFLRAQAQMVDPVEVPASTVADADDLPVLGTAIAARADCLVTGDLELQKLKRLQGIRILSPRAFYDRLR
jgi:uncharacterized protein